MLTTGGGALLPRAGMSPPKLTRRRTTTVEERGLVGSMDAAAFDELYHACSRQLVAQMYAVCGDLAEAQDVVQEAFARAWERREQLDLMDSPEGWLRTVAYRLAVSRWRRARNAATAWTRRAEKESVAGVSLDHVLLVSALRRIPESQRHAIVLHHLCDLPVEEVASLTGAPVGTVKARLSRGRTALASVLDEQAEEVDRV
ncbi:RNA polymerase sigma-70 factor, ECF subfamily [Austwickia chelonae]|nr:RNA polymerase sigma-70 factor, ECF subfamily [Austwickia chelonae]